MPARTFVIEKAVRSKARARIALAGVSGSGKTMTALITAGALGHKLLVIDTENGSASKYAPPPSRADRPGAGEFIFDRLEMRYYDPTDLVAALAQAGQHGYDVVIVDTLSKFWSGEGGMLEQVDRKKNNYGGNNFGGWNEARPMERAMLEALLNYPGHIIVTMRVRTAYEIQEENGRKKPVKIGLQPEQRGGIEYEFDVVADLDLSHEMVVTKTRCPALTGKAYLNPTQTFGEIIANWCDEGRELPSALDYRDQAVDKDQDFASLRVLHEEVRRAGLLGAAVIDDTGESVSLGDLIVRKGREARAQEEAAPPAGKPEARDPWDTGALQPSGDAAYDDVTGNRRDVPEPAPDDAGAPAGDGDGDAQLPAEDPDPAAEALSRPGPEQPGPQLGEWEREFIERVRGTDSKGDLIQRQKEVGARIRGGQTDAATGQQLMSVVAARRAELNGGQ